MSASTVTVHDGPAPEGLVEAVTGIPEFTAHDRCDRCGAQAYVGIRLKNAEGQPSTLLFCGHHGAKHLPVFTDPNRTGVIAIRDDRSLLDGENRLVGSEN